MDFVPTYVNLKNTNKIMKDICGMGEIYRLMLKIDLSIEEISSRLTAMRKLHNETPNAKVNVLFLSQLSVETLDKKNHDEFNKECNEILQEINNNE